MAAYSGDWTIVPEESEDLNRKMFNSIEDAASGRGGGGRPGGGGGMSGGGRRGGGGMAGGGGMRGGSRTMDPEEMRRSMEVIRGIAQVPEVLFLNLEPETVTLSAGNSEALIMTLGSERAEVDRGGVTLLATAKWTARGIEITRELRRGGSVKDKISLDEEGNLVLEREIDLMTRSVEGTLVYRRN